MNVLDNVRATIDAATIAMFEANSDEERDLMRKWLLSSAPALGYMIEDGRRAQELLVELQLVAGSL